MTEREYTLDELAEITGIRPRTIRHYIQRKLLNGPNSVGRGATYGEYHRKRLEVIRTLRDYHFSINQIAQYFRQAQSDEDIDLAVLPIDLSERGGGSRRASIDDLDFIQGRRSPEPDEEDHVSHAMQSAPDISDQQSHVADSAPTDSYAPPPTIGPIEQLLEQLRSLTADQRVARRTLGEEWVRFAATPDLEIHVRGEVSPEQLLLFEQIADHIRHILLGGDRHV